MIKLNNPDHKIKYISSFDTLRGLAVLAVLLFHGESSLFKGGWIGVDLFFVLSGYLITSILQSEYFLSKDISLSKFYFRRFFRLFPPLAVGVLIANMLWPLSNFNPNTSQSLPTLGSLFYFLNFLNPHITENMSHIWSLSVEEHFYFLWPLVLPFLLRISKRNCIRLLIITVILLSVFRILAFNYRDYLNHGLFVINCYSFTLCRIDSILFGALLAIISAKTNIYTIELLIDKKKTLFMVMLICIFLVIFFSLNIENPYWYNGGFLLTNILCTLTIFTAIKYQDHYIFSSPFLNWVGKRSYGIYIYHYPVFLFLERFRIFHNIASAIFINALLFLLSLAMAEISYKYIEQPIANYRTRINIKKSPDNVSTV